MKTNTIIDISPTHPPKFWVSSCQPIKLQEVNDEVYSLYADKHGGRLQVDTIILGECNQTCPKYPKVCISLEYLHNCMGDEIDFLPADKHNICLQGDNVTFSAHSQTGPKYQKQPVYYIFAKSQGKMKDKVDFFTAYKC